MKILLKFVIFAANLAEPVSAVCFGGGFGFVSAKVGDTLEYGKWFFVFGL